MDRDVPKTERVRTALCHQGVPVMHAGFSTLLAVVVLAGAESMGYVVLFRVLLGMVLFGLAHGLIFLPCCLQLVP